MIFKQNYFSSYQLTLLYDLIISKSIFYFLFYKIHLLLYSFPEINVTEATNQIESFILYK